MVTQLEINQEFSIFSKTWRMDTEFSHPAIYVLHRIGFFKWSINAASKKSPKSMLLGYSSYFSVQSNARIMQP